MKKSKLIPHDPERCQAEKRHGTFMTMGPPGKFVRCDKKPTHIAFEKEPGSDGLMGSMSLCRECLSEMEKTIGFRVRLEAIKA